MVTLSRHVRRIYAFFDFDGTLIPFDSIGRWLRFYYRRRPGRLLFLIPDALGFLLFGLRLISSHTLKRIFLWPMALRNRRAGFAGRVLRP